MQTSFRISSTDSFSPGKVFALFAVLAGAALIQESMNPVLKHGNVLERQAYGDGNYDAELIWEIPEKELE